MKISLATLIELHQWRRKKKGFGNFIFTLIHKMQPLVTHLNKYRYLALYQVTAKTFQLPCIEGCQVWNSIRLYHSNILIITNERSVNDQDHIVRKIIFFKCYDTKSTILYLHLIREHKPNQLVEQWISRDSVCQ